MLELGWLFTVPVLKLAIKIAVTLSSLFLAVQVYRWSTQSKPKNPLEKDARIPRKPYVHDQKKRNAVISQSFSMDKVPDGLDAIVVGSGIGGLTTAALMAKAGKRVLVLEQHDQAGGCCHTFVDKGFEFDVGIHYIGEMMTPTINRTLAEQITRGQLEWEPLDDEFDVISIGYGDENKRLPVPTGLDKWAAYLKKVYPDETEAIDKYFYLVSQTQKSSVLHGMLKIFPMWLVRIILFTGVLKFFTNAYNKVNYTRTIDVVNSLTTNKELRTVFTYCWGDYGTPPSRSSFNMQALLNRHFCNGGGAYPIGGASEIAYNIIPVIEEAGGKVLVRANVKGFVCKEGKVCGVQVEKGKETLEIIAPAVISSAGIYNTFLTLLPKEIAEKSYFTKIARSLKPGIAAMNVFLGLDISNEELEVRKQNVWAFTQPDTDEAALKYFSLDAESAMSAEIPLLFISFPSTKDPEWNKHEGRQGKSTCAIVTLANWEWFKQWEDKPVKRRGDDYDEMKNCIGHQMIEQTCNLFPQLRDKIVYTEIGSPVTNKHYLGQPNGEIYGLDHTKERFDPWMVARLRPETDIPGLYLTGQDILSCGFTGALFAGVISASVVLGRNLMGDLVKLHNKLNAPPKSKSV